MTKAEEILKNALEIIANPIKHFREEAEKEGNRLNGAYAHQIANDGGWLRNEAKKALEEYASLSSPESVQEGRGIVGWVNIEYKRYLLIDGNAYYSLVFDQWSDGEFEAENIDGSYRVLVSKNETGYFVANAMDGWGNNSKDHFKDSKVILLNPVSLPVPVEDEWIVPEEKLSGLYEMVELKFVDGNEIWRNTLMAELRELKPEYYNTILWRHIKK